MLIKTFGRLKGRSLSKNQKFGLSILKEKYDGFLDTKKKFGWKLVLGMEITLQSQQKEIAINLSQVVKYTKMELRLHVFLCFKTKQRMQEFFMEMRESCCIYLNMKFLTGYIFCSQIHGQKRGINQDGCSHHPILDIFLKF